LFHAVKELRANVQRLFAQFERPVNTAVNNAYFSWPEVVERLMSEISRFGRPRLSALCLLAIAFMPSLSNAQAPVFVIAPEEGSIRFYVKASVALVGDFDKWNAALTCASPDASTCVLDIKIQADSVRTGSGVKDTKLKSSDFFNAKQDPFITFLSKKIRQTGPNTFEVQGDFAIRGVAKSETLLLTVSGSGTGSGEIKGTMAFDRKDYGMTKGIPFIKIADRVEVTVDLKVTRTGGPSMNGVQP
jgi:polyisoprenoid-binding protein YceI